MIYRRRGRSVDRHLPYPYHGACNFEFIALGSARRRPLLNVKYFIYPANIWHTVINNEDLFIS